jgi:hypothetical protein
VARLGLSAAAPGLRVTGPAECAESRPPGRYGDALYQRVGIENRKSHRKESALLSLHVQQDSTVLGRCRLHSRVDGSLFRCARLRCADTRGDCSDDLRSAVRVQCWIQSLLQTLGRMLSAISWSLAIGCRTCGRRAACLRGSVSRSPWSSGLGADARSGGGRQPRSANLKRQCSQCRPLLDCGPLACSRTVRNRPPGPFFRAIPSIRKSGSALRTLQSSP